MRLEKNYKKMLFNVNKENVNFLEYLKITNNQQKSYIINMLLENYKKYLISTKKL